MFFNNNNNDTLFGSNVPAVLNKFDFAFQTEIFSSGAGPCTYNLFNLFTELPDCSGTFILGYFIPYGQTQEVANNSPATIHYNTTGSGFVFQEVVFNGVDPLSIETGDENCQFIIDLDNSSPGTYYWNYQVGTGGCIAFTVDPNGDCIDFACYPGVVTLSPGIVVQWGSSDVYICASDLPYDLNTLLSDISVVGNQNVTTTVTFDDPNNLISGCNPAVVFPIPLDHTFFNANPGILGTAMCGGNFNFALIPGTYALNVEICTDDLLAAENVYSDLPPNCEYCCDEFVYNIVIDETAEAGEVDGILQICVEPIV